MFPIGMITSISPSMDGCEEVWDGVVVVGGLGYRGRIEEAVFFHLLDQMIMIDQMIKIIQDREDQDQEEFSY